MRRCSSSGVLGQDKHRTVLWLLILSAAYQNKSLTVEYENMSTWQLFRYLSGHGDAPPPAGDITVRGEFRMSNIAGTISETLRFCPVSHEAQREQYSGNYFCSRVHSKLNARSCGFGPVHWWCKPLRYARANLLDVKLLSKSPHGFIVI